MSQYPPRGALFQNQNKQKETQPDYTGNLEIPNDVAQDIIAQINEGIEAPKIDLAGWLEEGWQKRFGFRVFTWKLRA